MMKILMLSIPLLVLSAAVHADSYNEYDQSFPPCRPVMSLEDSLRQIAQSEQDATEIKAAAQARNPELTHRLSSK